MSYLIATDWRDAARWHGEGVWQDVTIPGLLARAVADRPDSLAVVQGEARLTYRQLQAGVDRFAARLAELGVDRGDVVILHLPDSAAFLAVSMAVHSVEGVTAPVPHSAGQAEIASIAERTRARAYVGLTELDLPGVPHRIAMNPADLGLFEVPAEPVSGYQPDPDALAEIMFTSGTTGLPKGVMNSANTKLTGLRGFLETFDFGPDDVWAVVPPMSHNAGWLYSALPALATQAPMVLVRRGDPAAMLDTLAAEGVTACFLVPTHLTDLLAAYRKEPERYPLKLRHVLTGAALAPPEAVAAVADEWGAIPISLYGMTECQANLFTRPDDPVSTVATSVGRPCPGSEVALRDPADGRLVGEGEVGEVVTRGATTFLGYYDDQGATSSSFTKDGWFRSGDLGTIENGSFRIVGRIKEVILRGGATIVPTDVEAALSTYPGIGEVAVVGLPDERLGERVCACVLGPAPALEDLLAHLESSGFGRSVRPDLVVSVADFPRTDLGKVQRAKLRERLLKDA